MFRFFRSKTVGSSNFVKLLSSADCRFQIANRKSTILWQAGRRYETTSEYDNNLNYDKPFKPAYLFCLP